MNEEELKLVCMRKLKMREEAYMTPVRTINHSAGPAVDHVSLLHVPARRTIRPANDFYE